jgi:ketosteroid isomerase-like protein
VERSEEIRRIVERWFAALSAGDIEAVFSRFSDHPGVLAIGTDSGEWWHGHEHLEVWGNQIEEVGGATPVECEEVEASAELNLARGTVKKHLDNIFEKLGARNRIEAPRVWMAEPGDTIANDPRAVRSVA